ncbi:hypothetical protein F5I97DRAFT_2025845 [Phlebopus sp. FC_14]|nr:hypothetical protein F5I97DRAFT_2025845 [Phlebopus sp. FC_14]
MSRQTQESEQLLLDDPEDIPYNPVPKRYRPPFAIDKQRRLLTICVCVLALAVLALAPSLLTMAASRTPAQHVLSVPSTTDLEGNTLSYVMGPPTQNFRDNLRNDTKYITSWISAGWTNDVMTYGNLLYLAIITDRVPIIPKFIPSHVGGDTPPIAFGDVFDVSRLKKSLGIPILEWHEVKDVDSQTLEDLGCWTVWEVIQNGENKPRGSFLTEWLKLDISYTRAPDSIKLTPAGIDDKHSSFWSLATLAFPEARSNALSQPPYPSPQHQVSLPPDDHLLCYDYLYYVGVERAWEWELDYSPAWRFVGQHMRWNTSLQNLADEYVKRALNTSENDSTPPFISVHVRHGDFRNYCNDIPEDECFAPLPVLARRVFEVQQELRDRKGIEVSHVLMTSDERDPNWWSEVRKLGWTWIDYAAERTVETHGKWYPVLIDAVLQSKGAGFVGTYGSTMTTLARRRVESWQDGPTRVTKWGYPGADDH